MNNFKINIKREFTNPRTTKGKWLEVRTIRDVFWSYLKEDNAKWDMICSYIIALVFGLVDIYLMLFYEQSDYFSILIISLFFSVFLYIGEVAEKVMNEQKEYYNDETIFLEEVEI